MTVIWKKLSIDYLGNRLIIMLKNRSELMELIKFGNDIKKIINKWDPLEIRNISFQNEYSNEIKRIQNEFLKNKTIKNLNEKIKKIFKESYNGLYISSEEKELEIAKKIFERCNSILLE